MTSWRPNKVFQLFVQDGGDRGGNVMRTLLSGLLVALVLVCPARSEGADKPYQRIWPATGNRLLESCRSEDGVCLGWIIGLSDGIAILQIVGSSTPGGIDWQPVCTPKGVSPDQLKDVVVKFLVGHPEKRHEQASLLILEAMRLAWPCSQVRPAD